MLRDELVCLFALFASRVHPLLPVLLCCLSSAHRSSGLTFGLTVACSRGSAAGSVIHAGGGRPGAAARSAISSVCHFPLVRGQRAVKISGTGLREIGVCAGERTHRWEVDRGEPVATARLWEPVGISPPFARC